MFAYGATNGANTIWSVSQEWILFVTWIFCEGKTQTCLQGVALW